MADAASGCFATLNIAASGRPDVSVTPSDSDRFRRQSAECRSANSPSIRLSTLPNTSFYLRQRLGGRFAPRGRGVQRGIDDRLEIVERQVEEGAGGQRGRALVRRGRRRAGERAVDQLNAVEREPIRLCRERDTGRSQVLAHLRGAAGARDAAGQAAEGAGAGIDDLGEIDIHIGKTGWRQLAGNFLVVGGSTQGGGLTLGHVDLAVYVLERSSENAGVVGDRGIAGRG